MFMIVHKETKRTMAAAVAFVLALSIAAQLTSGMAHADTLQPPVSTTEGMRITLEGTSNTSDLGGYAAGSKRVRSDMLLRSDSLDRITASDARKLRDEYHVNLIIDLRTPSQIAAKPDVSIPGVRNVNLDVFGGVSDWPQDGPMYDAMAQYDSAVTAYKNVFDIMKSHTGGAILFHCSHGMDRTGVVAALIYHVLEVSDSDAMTNYLQSNTLLNVTWATPDLLNRWHADIDAEYGGMDSFLVTKLCVTAAEQTALRDKYLTPSDVSLTSLSIGGNPVDPDRARSGKASLQVADPTAIGANAVSAIASDPLAVVSTQVQNGKVCVTVTGQDTTTVQTYTVTLTAAARPAPAPTSGDGHHALPSNEQFHAASTGTLADTGSAETIPLTTGILLLLGGSGMALLIKNHRGTSTRQGIGR